MRVRTKAVIGHCSNPKTKYIYVICYTVFKLIHIFTLQLFYFNTIGHLLAALDSDADADNADSVRTEHLAYWENPRNPDEVDNRGTAERRFAADGTYCARDKSAYGAVPQEALSIARCAECSSKSHRDSSELLQEPS